jgi:hypothetical protein
MLHEALGGEHRHASGVDVVLADDALDTAKVVDVGVGVDHRGYRPLAPMLPVEGERGSGGLLGDQRVDHDDAAVAFDEADVRQIMAAHLVDAGHDFVQPVLGQQLALAPQARVGGVGR